MEFKKIQNNSLNFIAPYKNNTEHLPSENNKKTHIEEKDSPVNPEFWQSQTGITFSGKEELNSEILDFAEKLRKIDPEFYNVKNDDNSDRAIKLAEACFDHSKGKMDSQAIDFVYKYSIPKSSFDENGVKFKKTKGSNFPNLQKKYDKTSHIHYSNTFKKYLPDIINLMKDGTGSISSTNLKYMSKLIENPKFKDYPNMFFFNDIKNDKGVVEKEYFDFAMDIHNKIPNNNQISDYIKLRKQLGSRQYKKLETRLDTMDGFSSALGSILCVGKHCVDDKNKLVEEKIKILEKTFSKFCFFTPDDDYFEAMKNEENKKLIEEVLDDFNTTLVSFAKFVCFINKFKDKDGVLDSFAKESVFEARRSHISFEIATSVFEECVSDKNDIKNSFDFINYNKALNIYSKEPKLFMKVNATKLIPALKDGVLAADLSYLQKTLLHKSLVRILDDNKENQDLSYIKKMVADLDKLLLEDNRKRAVAIFNWVPEIKGKVDSEKIALLLKGDISPDDLEFNEKSTLYQALNSVVDKNEQKSFYQYLSEAVSGNKDYSDYEISFFKTLIQSLNKSLSTNKVYIDIPKDEKIKFATSVLAAPKGDNEYTQFESVIKESIPDFKKMKNGVPLKYSRQDFLKDLSLVFQSKKEAMDASKKIGVNFVFDQDNKIVGYEGIIVFNNADDLTDNEQKMVSLCKKFIFDNEAKTDNKELNNEINNIIKGLPEFVNIIGKKQHGTHKYTLDIHSLLVLANSVNNPDYLKLNDIDKVALKISSVLHDIDKHEGIIDTGHQDPSALYARSIVQKFFPNEEFRDRIFGIIKNHHWLAEYNLSTDKEPVIQKYAFEFRKPNDFEIAKIMARSDLMGVSDEFYEGHKNALDNKKLKLIEDKITDFYSSGCAIFSDKFTKRKTNKNLTQTLDGKEYTVVNLNQIADDASLFEYGFSPQTTKKNLKLLVHMIHDNNLADGLSTIKSLSSSVDNIELSESLITPIYNKTYMNRKYGVLLSQINSNIINLHSSNQSTGVKKNKKDAISSIFENDDNRIKYREELLKRLGINPKTVSDKDYAEFYKSCLINKTTLNQFVNSKIYKIGKHEVLGKELKKAINKIQDSLIDKECGTHNEIVGFSPKINAIVAKQKMLENVDKAVLDFAYKNNLPIILI